MPVRAKGYDLKGSAGFYAYKKGECGCLIREIIPAGLPLKQSFFKHRFSYKCQTKINMVLWFF